MDHWKLVMHVGVRKERPKGWMVQLREGRLAARALIVGRKGRKAKKGKKKRQTAKEKEDEKFRRALLRLGGEKTIARMGLGTEVRGVEG